MLYKKIKNTLGNNSDIKDQISRMKELECYRFIICCLCY